MDNKKAISTIAGLAAKYPEVEEVRFDYRGSGDSFDSYDVDTSPRGKEVDTEDFEELFWEILDDVGANFNNDGGNGMVTFNLKEISYSVEDYYNVMESALNISRTITQDDV